MSCMKNVFKDKYEICDGPLVSSQERRAAVVRRISRGICSPIGFHRNSFVRVSEESIVQDNLFRSPGPPRIQEGQLFPWRIVPSASCPARPAPPCRPAVRRPNPLVVCPGFGFDKYACATPASSRAVVFGNLGVSKMSRMVIGRTVVQPVFWGRR